MLYVPGIEGVYDNKYLNKMSVKKSFDTIEEIRCPHCGEICGFETADNGEELITYWGDEATDMECRVCNKQFIVQERVCRDWEVVKVIDDL